jgi:arabinogalactan endo-1,4-beta-galactosidase
MRLEQMRIKGADISSLKEVESSGGRFYDTESDQPEDAMRILQRVGMNLLRLRLWNDPYDEAGNPYGAGTNDLACTMELAARAKKLGIPWLLDFHYSDFWADPGKQYLPKAWRDLGEDELEEAVYSYTKKILTALKAAGLLPSMVAPGNEITNGLLWPAGKVPNWERIARIVSAGICAVREISPECSVMIHLDNGGNKELYRTWFDHFLANGGADFDCIGLSYYPFWHGTMRDLAENMNMLALRYGKPLIVAETSMAFTLSECNAFEDLRLDQKRGLAVNQKNAQKAGYPISPEGQSAFLADLWNVIRSVPNDLGRGLIWWEPAWIPTHGVGWTNPAGLEYIHEKGPGGNEWANQCLFDYYGRALPSLKAFASLS